MRVGTWRRFAPPGGGFVGVVVRRWHAVDKRDTWGGATGLGFSPGCRDKGGRCRKATVADLGDRIPSGHVSVHNRKYSRGHEEGTGNVLLRRTEEEGRARVGVLLAPSATIHFIRIKSTLVEAATAVRLVFGSLQTSEPPRQLSPVNETFLLVDYATARRPDGEPPRYEHDCTMVAPPVSLISCLV